MDPKAYWVGFNQVRGIGSVRIRSLLDFFGDLQTAWDAPAQALRSAGLTEKIVEAFFQVRRQIDLEQELEKARQSGVEIVTWEDDQYPSLLKEISQPPPILYVRGKLKPEDELAVAIVGTRKFTSYGRQVAEEIAEFLVHQGITVVSGLARGIDAVAHATTLKAGGRTIAVLGSGVDRIYPPEHEKLAGRIIESGAVISDYALGTPPEAVNFPPRNRIISGLTKATIVIEAGTDSGALITAEFAADQGREVLAVPGSIYAPQSKGTNRLIQQGARPLLQLKDILDALSLEQTQWQQQRDARTLLPADDIEKKILLVVGIEPLHIDEISALAGLPIEKISATLTMMELKGMVRQVGGMNYTAVREIRDDYRMNL